MQVLYRQNVGTESLGILMRTKLQQISDYTMLCCLLVRCLVRTSRGLRHRLSTGCRRIGHGIICWV